jgi:KDO2-lipid IV(A) lauroyltransferase
LPLSHLPLGLLYRLSGACRFVLFHVIRYRRRVVDENLERAFPGTTSRERKRLARRYYTHLGDLLAESVRGFSMSRAEASCRYRFVNPELLEAYAARGRPVTILGSHYGNWEWVALSLPLVTTFHTHGIYQRLSNPFLDRHLRRSRERHGMTLVSKNDVAAALEAGRDQPISMGYIGDQSPSRTGRNTWVTFLNQPTAVTTGFEHYAREYDTPVLYLSVVKVARGRYEGTFHLLTDEPRRLPEGELVRLYMRTLEGYIVERPEHWLWSHRRWKLRPPASP